jgi:hypothetical protein
MSEEDFKEVLNELEDKSVKFDSKQTPTSFSGRNVKIDDALRKIASFRANETCAEEFFESREAYVAYKQELNDREIVELLRVRDENPELIDSFIDLMD